MKLTVLGSGSCVVDQAHRNSSGYILEIGEQVIMVDTGTGSTKSLSESEIAVDEIDSVVNTHRHPDHVSDLVPILQDKVVRSFSQEEPGVAFYGPEGHEEYLEDRVRHEMAERVEELDGKFGFPLEVVEIDREGELELGEVLLNSTEALHGPEEFICLSLRFSRGGKSIVFTGDTDYNPELEDFAEGANLLVTDCSRPAGEEVEGHMNAVECARLAERAGVEKLVLSHLYPEAERGDLKRAASEIFDGEIVVADDLLEVR